MHDAGTSPAPERGLDRRTAWVVLVVTTAVLGLLAWRLVPWDWVPGRTLHPASPRSVLSGRDIARAEHYNDYVRPPTGVQVDDEGTRIER